DWDAHRDFSEALARVMAADSPDRYVATMSKKKRQGKIFVDYLRNTRGATAIAPFSSRARKGAFVSVPVSWAQLSRMKDAHPVAVGEIKRFMGTRDNSNFERDDVSVPGRNWAARALNLPPGRASNGDGSLPFAVGADGLAILREGAMIRKFRKTLMATTMLAGLVVFSIDQGWAGPNSPNISPSMGSISSMRPDFTMRGPNALRDRDLGSPRDPAVLTPKKSKKNAVGTKSRKKGADTASRGTRSRPVGKVGGTSNPTPSSGGKGTPSAGKGGDLAGINNGALNHLRAYLDAISMSAAERRGLKELIDILQTGPLVAAHTPGGRDGTAADPKGDLESRFSHPINPETSDDTGWSGLDNIPGAPRYGGGSSQRGHKGGVFGWGPGGATDGSKDPSGQAGYGGSDPARRNADGSITYHSWGTVEDSRGGAPIYFDIETTVWNDENGNEQASADRTTFVDRDGHATVVLNEYDGNDASAAPNTRVYKDGVLVCEGGGCRPTPSDSNPVAEGTGRPSGGGYKSVSAWVGGRNVICDFFGCREGGTTRGKIGDPGRDNPEGSSTVAGPSGPSAGPGAATDPCPECGGRVSGGGGLRPPGGSDVGWTGPGGGDGGFTPPPPAGR
ncbi:MAG: hypothetical protein K8F31_05780, partial [Roseovarius sp.]|nr:hypothetical protein [Roseovarius sp.]